MIEKTKDLKILAENRQLISNNRIVLPWQISTFDSFRILEKPLYELIIRDLKESSWTIDELAIKYGISKEDIREPLTIAMRDPVFTAEGFIPRRVGRIKRNGKGSNVQYALLPIPIEARIFDITFGLSLLHFDSLLTKHVDQLQFLSYSDGLYSFKETIVNCWNIDEDKIHQYINKHDGDCILSAIGPLFIPKERGIFEKIRLKLFEEEKLLIPRFNRRNIDTIIRNIRRAFNEGFIDITDLHNTVIEFSDLTRYCKYRNLMSEYKELIDISEDVFYSLFIQLPEKNVIPVQETKIVANEDLSIPKEPVQSVTVNEEVSIGTNSVISEISVDESIAEIHKVQTSDRVKISEQQSALREIKKNLDTPGAFDLVVHCLSTSNSINIQKEAIKILTILNDERAIDILINAYKKVGFYLSLEIIRILGSIGSPKSLPLLYEVLNSKHLEQRIAAINALGKLKNPQVTSILIQQFKDPKIEIKKIAVRALGENSDGGAVPALINILKYSNSTIRVEAIRALVKLDPIQALPYIQQACNDESKAVREEAKRSLEIRLN